jgi:hypothetical protein
VVSRLVLAAVVVFLAGCSQSPPVPAVDATEVASECTGGSSTDGRTTLTPVTEPRQHTYDIPAHGMHYGAVDFAAFKVVLGDPSGPVVVSLQGPEGQPISVRGSGTLDDPWFALVPNPVPGDYVLGIRSDQPVVVQRTWFAYTFQAGDRPEFQCEGMMEPPINA